MAMPIQSLSAMNAQGGSSQPTNPPPQGDFEQAVEMLATAETEIKRLRDIINRLKPAADAYETVCKILGLVHQNTGGELSGPDMRFQITRFLERINEKKLTEILNNGN